MSVSQDEAIAAILRLLRENQMVAVIYALPDNKDWLEAMEEVAAKYYEPGQQMLFRVPDTATDADNTEK